MKHIIALVFDFDDTLAPDSISQFLEGVGVNAPDFWRKTVDPLLEQGWDPVPATMYRLLMTSQTGRKPFTREAFAAAGKSLQLFPGVTTFFPKLRDYTGTLSAELGLEFDIEFYIISSGIETIIRKTRIAKHFTDVWGSDFLYCDVSGEIVFPKNVVSFTDKTRYLFQISKGIYGEKARRTPFEVNRKEEKGGLRIPINRMVFIGDGYTDVPCFSLMQQYGGTAIAVYDRDRREKWGRAWGFTQTGRATNIAPADYRKNSALHDSLVMAIERICRTIALEKRLFIV